MRMGCCLLHVDYVLDVDKLRLARGSPNYRLTHICFPDIQVWDILEELVDVCTIPPPLNPFSVDRTYIQSFAIDV